MPELETNVPNLDVMDADELMAFHEKHKHGRKPGLELFPSKPKGYVMATLKLACYAATAATAIRCRLNGQIETALSYEDICDRIFKQFPEWARW